MKNISKILILIIAISLLGCNAHSTKNSSVKISKSQIAQYENVFKNLKEYLAKENGKLWNHQLYGALMFVNRSNRTIIANEPDNSGVLTKKGGVYVGILPKGINIANTAFDWNGKRWSMVMLPLPKNHNERLNLLIHELFHRIQPKIGFANLITKQSNHLDDLNGRIYLKLELAALSKALESDNPAVRQKHIRDALLFRHYRYELYPGAKEAENTLEIKEGLAEYTGSILSDRTDKALKEHYINAINNFYNYPTFVRSFAYVTIPVYGYFMNLKNPGWNKGITKSTNLTDFITKFFNVTIPSHLKDTINSIKDAYGFNKISAFEIKRAGQRKKLMAEYEIKFVENPTLTIRFEKMNIQFDPRNIMPFKNLGTVYPNMRITDNWGILTVKNGALLGGNWHKVTVSEPIEITDTIIKGDGWKLQLHDGWELVKIGKNYILKRK
jgi:hypothetical protein